MRRLAISVSLVVVIIALASAAPHSARAQGDAPIEQLQIALWPEFDRPAVLVIYRIRLPAAWTYPATVRVPIPASVGDPHAVAWADEEGQLIVASYEREVQGSWTLITVSTKSSFVQVEYYQDLTKDGAARSFTFEWPEGFGAEAVLYEVQQPVGGSEMEIKPAPSDSVLGEDGLTYLRGDLGPVPGTSSFTLQVEYQKGDERLTADSQAGTGALPLSRPSSPQGATPDLAPLLPWILGGVGGILLLVGGILYARSVWEAKARRTGRPRPGDRRRTSTGEEASPIFCHQCGTRASASDRYCRHCGARLRTAQRSSR